MKGITNVAATIQSSLDIPKLRHVVMNKDPQVLSSCCDFREKKMDLRVTMVLLRYLRILEPRTYTNLSTLGI